MDRVLAFDMLFRTLFRYFGMHYVAWVAMSVIGLTGIVTIVQSVEFLRRLGNKVQEAENYSVVGLALLNIPSVMELILPIALIIGSMLCFDSWNRSNEFVVARGFGLSIWSVLGSVIAAAFMVGVLFVGILNPIGSVTSREYEDRMGTLFGHGQKRLSVSADGIWLRDSHDDGRFIIHSNALDVESANIVDPVIFTFDAGRSLDRRIRADSMHLTESGWIVENAVEWDSQGVRTEAGTIVLPTSLAALDLGLSSEKPSTIAVYALPAFIRLLERAGLPSVDHRMHFNRLLSLPFLLAGLAMITARMTLRNQQRGKRVRLFTRGVLITVSILLFSQFMQVLGSSMRLPTMLAAWAPAVAVVLVGAIMLARMDEA